MQAPTNTACNPDNTLKSKQLHETPPQSIEDVSPNDEQHQRKDEDDAENTCDNHSSHQAPGEDKGTAEKAINDIMKKSMDSFDVCKEKQDRMLKHINEHGCENIQEFLFAELKDLDTCRVNIAITGHSGAGKSSLINVMRNLTAEDEEAAETGVSETTIKCTPFAYSALPNVTLWDLPGFNTQRFNFETYSTDMELHKYDAVIICTSERCTHDSLRIAQEAKKAGQPLYILRTKIDQDVQNNMRDKPNSHNEAKLLESIKRDIEDNMRMANLDTDNIYLISSCMCDIGRWDYMRFTQDLIQKAPEDKQNALILALRATTRDAVKKKKNILQQRIPFVALQIVAAGSLEAQQIARSEEQQQYAQTFGTTPDMEIIFMGHQIVKSGKSALVSAAGVTTVIGGVIGGVAEIGTGVGVAAGAIGGLALATVGIVPIMAGFATIELLKYLSANAIAIEVETKYLQKLLNIYEKAAVKILEELHYSKRD